MMDLVQDKGRTGFQYLGINPSGVMDRYAMQVANALVGNDPNEAVIEMHFPAPVILFSYPALIAISGADFTADLNGEPLPHLHPVWVDKNDVLQFHKPIHGTRAYLAIAGGVHADEWLGSRSTNLKAGRGGFGGRQLRKGDELLLRQSFPQPPGGNGFRILPWKADTYWGDDIKEIAVLPGNEYERLCTASRESFALTSFVITRHSDRMGYHLDNIPLPVMTQQELVSSAVNFGTVQLLPDGKLIILMADHQTAGGYPKIAHVISAHHSRLAQMKAGDRIRFRVTRQSVAEEMYYRQQQHLLQLQNACTFRLEEYFHAAFDQL